MRLFLLVLALGVLGCANGEAPDDAGRQTGDASVASEDGSVGGGERCAALACDANARCDTATGAPRCVCNDGYAGTGQVCQDVDECAVDPTRCAPNDCVNLPGSFACDECPDDPDKIAPGVCGCGVPDTDRDADGTFDCIDGCPDDPAKNEPGECGCGVPETDTDGDGTPDCVDGCPDDPDKTEPGACGCGMPDSDRDGDGVLDCVDGCPDDPLKTEPGVCGCGEPEPVGVSSTVGVPREDNYTNGPYFRGNVYLPSSTTTLRSFDQYLGLPSSCTLGFHVARGSSASGPWTPLWSTSRSATATGSTYHSSGTIGITLNAGSYYMLGVGWSCTGVAYGGSGASIGTNTTIGAVQGYAWDNAYPGHSSGYTPSGASSLRAYSQRVHAVGPCR